MAAELIMAPEAEADLDEAYSLVRGAAYRPGRRFPWLRRCLHPGDLPNTSDARGGSRELSARAGPTVPLRCLLRVRRGESDRLLRFSYLPESREMETTTSLNGERGKSTGPRREARQGIRNSSDQP